MLLPAPIQFRKHRRRRVRAAAPVTVGPVLVSATLISPTEIRLVFDREVVAPEFDAAQITVQTPQQGPFANDNVGAGQAGRPGPLVIDVSLQKIGPPIGTIDTLTATANTGIESLDGEPWAGVAALPLPFGV